MSFFADLPEPEPHGERYVEPEWQRIPHEVVPGQVALNQLVHRSNELALAIEGVDVYPRGLAFSAVAIRHPEGAEGGDSLHEAFHGGPRHRQQVLRVGVLFDDGRRAAYPDDMYARDGEEHRGGPPAASITSRGGSSTNSAAGTTFYVWPLPEEGDLTLFFRWDEAGLDEARVVLDGDALRAAASRATEIWPGAQPPDPGERPA